MSRHFNEQKLYKPLQTLLCQPMLVLEYEFADTLADNRDDSKVYI